MKRISSDTSAVIAIEVTQIEYHAIATALGETLEALEDWEFETRTGVDRPTMRRLLREFRTLDPEPPLDPEPRR